MPDRRSHDHIGNFNLLGSVITKLDKLASTMNADEQAVLADILSDDDTAGYTGVWPGTKQLIGNTRLKQLTPKVMGGSGADSGI